MLLDYFVLIIRLGMDAVVVHILRGMMNRPYVSLLVLVKTFLVNWLRINAMVVIPVVSGLNVVVITVSGVDWLKVVGRRFEMKVGLL